MNSKKGSKETIDEHEKMLADIGIQTNKHSKATAVVDQICSKFEKQWQSDGPIESLLQFSNQVSDENRAELLLELAILDMELRWKEWAECEFECYSKGERSTSAKQRIASFGVYSRVLRIEQFSAELEEHEFWCRSRYGDFPSIRTDMPNPKIAVLKNQNEIYRDEFAGAISIGRQENHECAPYAWSKLHSSKLIVAEVNNLSVSRTQAVVQLHTDRLIEVKNSSSNRAFGVISNCKNQSQSVLASMDSMVLPMPVLINLSGIVVKVFVEESS